MSRGPTTTSTPRESSPTRRPRSTCAPDATGSFPLGEGHLVVVPKHRARPSPALASRRAGSTATTAADQNAASITSTRSPITDATSKRKSTPCTPTRRQPGGGQPAQAQLLGPRHRLDRRTEPIRCPRLHLAEHDRRFSHHDQVDLPLATTPVAIDHGVALRLVPVCGEGLASRAERRRPRDLQTSRLGSSSTFTSLNVRTRTGGTNRVCRYMSHTQASRSSTSINGRGPSPVHAHVDFVGEVEAPLGLHRVSEHRRDVAGTPAQLELELGLELSRSSSSSGARSRPLRFASP